MGAIFPMSEHRTTVLSNEPVNDRYRELVLAAPPGACHARPGQFFHLLCPPDGDDHPFFRRPMSVYAADPDAGQVRFLYKVTGVGTRGMARLRAGDSFEIFGPLGVGFTLPEDARAIVMLARGVGLATLAPLAGMARARGVTATAVFSASEPAYLMSLDAMREQGAAVITVTDSEGTSGVENVERILRDLHAQGRMDRIYTCGSNRLMQLAQRLEKDLGIAGEVALEQQMACAIGMCFCCVRSFREGDEIVHRRVCCEGPVFPLSEALSW